MAAWNTYNFELSSEEAAEEFTARVKADINEFSPGEDETAQVDRFEEYVYVQAPADSRSERELESPEIIERYATDWERAAILTMNSVTESGRALIYGKNDAGEPEPLYHLRGEEHNAMLDVICQLDSDFRLRATATGDPGIDMFILGVRRPDSSNVLDLAAEDWAYLTEEADVERLDLDWNDY